jgi:hypothetical protein
MTVVTALGGPRQAERGRHMTMSFLVSVRWLPVWRAQVVSTPPVLLIALNGWRFIGLGFLMGYQEGLLPGGSAWPARLGDIGMAVTAPWIAARVAADDPFRLGSGFLTLLEQRR